MTGVAIVGGGPAGVMPAHLLARGGAEVTLLESRGDFDRRFRGDSIAPPVLDHLDVLGPADPMLAALPHVRADAFVRNTPQRRYVLADHRSASAKYPFYALIPQAEFLPRKAILDAAEAANRLVGPLTATPVDPAAVDAAGAEVERVRRPASTPSSRRQVAIERSTAERLRSGDPRPPGVLRVLSAIPGGARLVAGRRARQLAAHVPVPSILRPLPPEDRTAAQRAGITDAP